MSSAAVKQLYEDDTQLDHAEQTADSVGRILQTNREQQKLAIDKVAKILRISQIYLEALENNDASRLPETVYTIGFLKTYSAHLGLNPDEMVNLYKTQSIKIHKTETLSFPVPAPERHIPSKWLVLIACGLAGLIVIAWMYLKPWSPAAAPDDLITPQIALEQGMGEQTPSTPETATTSMPETPVASAPETPTEASIAEAPQEEASPVISLQNPPSSQQSRSSEIVIQNKNLYLGEGQNMIIMATVPTWIEIKKADGNILISRTLKQGESREVSSQEGLILSTGNAGGLSFYVNGRYYSPLGKTGEVMSGLQLQFKEKPMGQAE